MCEEVVVRKINHIFASLHCLKQCPGSLNDVLVYTVARCLPLSTPYPPMVHQLPISKVMVICKDPQAVCQVPPSNKKGSKI